MGNRITSVPGNLLKYAGKGISYSKSKVFKEEMNYDPNLEKNYNVLKSKVMNSKELLNKRKKQETEN